MRNFIIFSLVLTLQTSFGQVNITIDPTKDLKNISSAIYGRNNSLPKESYATGLAPADYIRLRESGVQFLREGGGNNATKYNWRNKLSSHPDWYNNVYSESWDVAVKTMIDSLPSSVNGMWSFQLIGKAASNTGNNFNDYAYNKSTYWQGVNQNLAGGGVPNTAGGNKAAVEGNPNLYLQNWTADSTTGILDYWFNNLKIPKQRVTYWNMDNEVEIWNGTHDDIISSSYQAETFMQSYFAVAKKARDKFPDIKLVGPVTANEWQWYDWMNKITGADGKNYAWLESFIKRCAEEQKATGIKLLDVLDIHFYPSESAPEQVVQLHNVFFNRTYVYSGANGVKNVSGTWDNSQNKEYIFGRVNDWLTQYFGINNGIKVGVTEMDVNNNTPSVVAVWYASMLGEFMKNDVEIFTPWSWKTGMWETLHLFARYNKTQSVQGLSSDETNVSAYPTLNATKDSMTIVLVNRSTSDTKSTQLNLTNFTLQNAIADALRLASLPTTETFISHTQNALQKSTINFVNNTAAVSLPPLSITSIILKGKVTTTPTNNIVGETIRVFPNPFSESLTIEIPNGGFETISILDVNGKRISTHIITVNDKHVEIKTALSAGTYFVELGNANGKITKVVIAE